MKILVTGGAGYIGSFMVKRLVERGDNVVVLDNLERGDKKVVDFGAKLIEGNVLNIKLIQNVFEEHSFDAVIHLAGYISMEESVREPGSYFSNNSSGALGLIEQAVKHKVKYFIFSSTAGVYGNPIKIPIPEDHPTSPTNPYGESKLIVEKILYWYKIVYGLNFISLRYFNASGAAFDGSMGENHKPETHIIPNAIRAALTSSEFVLYGNDYNTKDGTCIRDYIHVIDLVEAHISSLERLQKENGGFLYNVGTGNGYSNNEVIEMIKKVSGVNFNVKIAKKRPGDADVLIADPTKIEKELGFKPKYSSLETIVKSAWKWYVKNLKLKTPAQSETRQRRQNSK